MPVEVNALKELLGDWLLAISGMSALVGTRVHNGWPQEPPEFPMIVYAQDGPREPNTDFPQHAWAISIAIDLWSTDSDELDTLDDLIVNALAGTVVETLLTDSRVLCHHVKLTGVGPDTEAVSMEDGSYVALSRTLTLAFSIVGKEI